MDSSELREKGVDEIATLLKNLREEAVSELSDNAERYKALGITIAIPPDSDCRLLAAEILEKAAYAVVVERAKDMARTRFRLPGSMF